MKKVFFIFLSIIALLTVSFYVLKTKVGDFRPVVLPPSKNLGKIATTSPQQIGVSPNFPLHLPVGFKIGIFAQNLAGPRAMVFTPDGNTLLVSLTSAGKVVSLSDTKGSGVADKEKVLLSGLTNPQGMAFYGGYFYLAEETRLSRFNWDPQNLALTDQKILLNLPKGGRHFTRSIVFDKSGRLFITIGSTCDVCFEPNPWYASIIVTDKDGNNPQLFAKGLRNSVFMTINPASGELWVTEMGRDWLGDETPPDEINIIRQGGDYGWPICYGDKIHDTDFDKKVYFLDPCLNTQSPIYKIPAHSAPLGLVFINSPQFPKSWQGDLLVAYHGSWNRSTPTGYKVVHLKVDGNKILNEEDFLTGFLSGSQALARPVDLVFDKDGSLYISDDKAGYILKIVGNQ